MALNSDLLKGHGQASPRRSYNLSHSWWIPEVGVSKMNPG